MKAYEVEREIEAEERIVWEILTDAARLTGGRFGILRIDGAIRAGETISLWSEVAPKRRFRIRVEKIDPGEMIWASGMPLGLFRGERRFEVRPSGTGVWFQMSETYGGPLRGPMMRIIPDLQPSFERFADGLKEAAEGRR